MEFTHTSLFSVNRPKSEANQAAQAIAPEWHALKARFIAAHDARRELQGAGRHGAIRRGGFAHWIAGTEKQKLIGVNPVASADGKDTAGNSAVTADNAQSGERGK
jgi:hypothetical protein